MKIITDSMIEKGIEDGTFKKNPVNIIRDQDGRIVKHQKSNTSQSNYIPPTLSSM
ncbi:hypothetical protein ThvES_00016990 [Thiovulum sp. ES]|nr:hypothetical protein ThvES_00016990 [Thiovulum sp. ES]